MNNINSFISILFCGDVMPGGVLPYQDKYITPELQDYMKEFDFRIGTLEAAIGTNYSFDPVKVKGRKNIIYARDEDFFRIKEMGFDVVSLANNHIWDLGEEGLRNTIEILQTNGIKYCGAGLNYEEASQPAIIEKEGMQIAVLAFCMYGNKYLGHVELAGNNKAGINPLDIDKVLKDIKDAKKKYDKVIVLPHWGREYRYEPLPECIAMAKQMIVAGADAIFGSHPHQIQPLISIKGKPICFSMGNFLFPDFYMYPPRPIWYPNSAEELKGIKDVVGYPYPIDEPIRQVWNPVSRYGCTIGFYISKKKTDVEIQFVHLTDENVESLANPDKNTLTKLRRASLMLSNPYYRLLIQFKRKIQSLIKRVYS